MSFESVLSLNEFCHQKNKNSKSNKSKFPFTSSPLHLFREKMENNVKIESCKMDLANSLITTDIR